MDKNYFKSCIEYINDEWNGMSESSEKHKKILKTSFKHRISILSIIICYKTKCPLEKK